MAKSRFKEEAATELNLTTFMNLVMLLIPFLLLQQEFVAYSVVNVNVPAAASGGGGGEKPEDEEEPLNLSVNVTKRGFYIAAAGGVLPNIGTAGATGEAEPTIPLLPDGSYDYKKLTELMQTIKDKRPKETKVIINLAPDVIYDIVVKTMDATRETPDHQRILFPDCAVAAGFK